VIPPSLAASVLEREVLPAANALPTQTIEDSSQPIVSDLPLADPTAAFLGQDIVLQEAESPEEESEGEASSGSTLEDAVEDNKEAADGAEVDEAQQDELKSEEAHSGNIFKDSFENVISYLSEAKDFAAAAIHSISRQNLIDLAKQTYEIGVAVVEGVILLFTSHSPNEISVPESFKKLLDKVSSVFLHFQPNDPKPSLVDQENAADREAYDSSRVEYTGSLLHSLTDEEDIEVYTYNSQTINPEVGDADFLLNEILKAADPNADEQKLQYWNDYLAKLRDEKELVLLRSEPPTVFPGKPVLGSFASASPDPVGFISITQSSTSEFKMDYNVNNSGSFVGASMSFSSPQNLNGNTKFVFEMKIDAGSNCTGRNCIKVEFKDADGDVAIKHLQNLTTVFQQKDIFKSDLLANNASVDFTEIVQINFVVDTALASPNVGSIEINTGGLHFEPPVLVGAGPVTNLSSFQPPVSELEPAGRNTVTSFQQPSKDQFIFDYNLANGADVDASRWGGAIMTFSTPFDLNGGDLVFLAQGTGTQKMKVELISGTSPNEKKVITILQNLTNAPQFYRITKAIADSAQEPGFNPADIRAVTFVVDDGTAGSKTASGQITVNSQGLYFSPVAILTADPLTDFSAKQPLANELEPCSVIGQNPCTSGTLNTVTLFNQDTKDHLLFNYDLGNGANSGFRRFAGGTLNFDTSLLDTTPPVVLGLKGTGTSKLKLDFVDDTGDRVTVQVGGVSSSFQNFKVTKAMLDSAGVPGFDATKIKAIAVVVDNVAAGSNTATGSVEINTQGLMFMPVAPTTANPVTNFSADRPVANELEPCSVVGQDPCTSGTLNTVTTFNQDSNAHFLLNFNLSNGSDTGGRRFAGATIDFQAERIDTTPGIVLGLKGTGTTGGQLKLEFIDTNNRKVIVKVQNLTGSFQNFIITKALLDSAGVPSYDATQIRIISVVVDNTTTGSTTAVGTIEVNTSGLAFIPPAEETLDPLTNFSVEQPIAGELEPCATAGQDPCISGTLNTITQFEQDSTGHFFFDFDLANGNDTGFRRFGGALIGFDSSSFDTTGNPIVLGLKGTGTTGGKLKLDIVDINNKKVTIRVENLTNAFKNYKITKALLDSVGISGFDSTKIAAIAVVVDDNTTGSGIATGTIEVNTLGLKFTPQAEETVDPVTNFTSKQPTAGELEPCATAGQDPCTSGTLNTISLFNHDSKDHFLFDFNLGNGSDIGFRRFGGAIIGFDAADLFDTTGNPIILGLKGAGTTGGKLKLVIEDLNKNQVTVRVENLTNAFKNYKITKALLDGAAVPGFDATKISAIVVVVDDSTTGSKTAAGTIEVNTQGLSFKPLAVETLDPVTDFTVEQPVLGEVEPCATAGQDPCTSGTLNTITLLNQDSKDHFAFNFNLGNGSDTGFRRWGALLMGFDTTSFDATTPIVLGLKGTGTTGGKLKIEVTDINGEKVTVQVENLTNIFKNYKITQSLLESAGVPGFDATQIVAMVFVVDDNTTGSTTAVGTIDVNTQGLLFMPSATVTVDPVTNFNALQPIANELEPCATAGQDPCTSGTLNTITVFNQDSANHVLMNFDLANGADLGFRRFGGGTINFDNGLLDMNTTTSVILGLKAAGTAKLKLEFIDGSGGEKVVVKVNGLTGSFQNFQVTKALLESAGVPGFDVDKIKTIAVVVDDQLAGSTTANGSIEINTQGLAFSPVAVVTADPLRDFSAKQPVAGELEPCAAAGQDPCTSGTLNTVTLFNQDTKDHFKFDYNLANGSDTGFRRFGGALISFDPNTISSNLAIVIGLKGTGTTGGKVKLEFIDDSGDKVIVKVNNLTTSFQNFKISKALLDSAGVPGFDSTKVQFMTIIVDDQTTGSSSAAGSIEANIKGMAFQPTAVITADPLRDFSAKKPVPAELEPCATAGQDPCTSGTLNTVTLFDQDTKDHFKFDYDLGNGADDGRRFAGAFVNFSPNTFSANLAVVVGLKGTGTTGGKAKIEFVDDTGDKATVKITGLTNAFQNYKISKALLDSAGIPGFDSTKIVGMTFVVDDGTTGSKTAVGTLDVNLKGMAFQPTAVVTADPLRDFSAKQPVPSELEPCSTVGQNPCTSGTLNTVTLFNQDTKDHFQFNYDLGNGSDTGFRRFAGSFINFAPNTFSSNLAIVIGLKGTGTTGGKLKLEFIDDTGDKVTVKVNGLTNAFQNYKVTKAMLDSAGVTGFDSTKITAMAVVVDDNTTGSTTAAGTIDVNLKGMKFVPSALITADPVSNFTAKKPTAGVLEPCATAGQNPCTSGTLNTIPVFNQDTPDHFAFDFNLANGSDTGFRRFGGGIINFGTDFLDTTGNPVVLGLKGTGTTGGKLKLDFVDDTGDKVTINVTGLTGAFQNYKVTKGMLDSAGVAGFDATKISSIVIVVDNNTTGSTTAAGTIEVNTQGLQFLPLAVITASPVTDFTAKQPAANEIEPCATAGQDPCTSGTLNTITLFNQDTKDHFKFDFNLGNGSDTGFRRFGGALINFGTDFFDTTGTPIVLGLKGTGTTGGKLKLEFVDDSGEKVTVRVEGLTSSFQNYEVTKALLDGAGVAGFDATQIASIVVVVDDGTTGSTTATGTIDVNTKGLFFTPKAVITADPLRDFSAKQPTPSELEPCATAGQDPCISGTLNTVTLFNQDSANHFALNFDLGNGSDTGFRRFAGALINFDPSSISSNLAIVIGLKGAGTTGGKVKLEFIDDTGDKVIVIADSLTSSFQNYKITKALLDSAGVPGFDSTLIRFFTIVVDDQTAGSTTAVGTVEANIQGMKFTPTAAITANPVTDFTAKKPVIGEIEPCATAGQDPCTSGVLNTITLLDQDSADHFLFNFDLSNGSDTGFRRFGATQINFQSNYFDTTGTPIVLGLKGTGTTGNKLKLEFEDDNKDKVTVNISGLTSSFQNFEVTKALLDSANVPGFDSTKISSIVIVTDNTTTGSTTAAGTIDVNTKGLAFNPTAVVTADPVTNFSGKQAVAGEIEPCATAGQDPCVSGTLNTVTLFNQDNANHFLFNYDLGNGSDIGFRRFAGAQITFQSGTFDTTGNAVVVGLKGTGTTGGKLKLDFVDDTGDKVTINVTGLTGAFQNYKITKALLDSAGVAGFDSTKVKTIVIVTDNVTTGSSIAGGTIEVNTQNLVFLPTAVVTANPVTNFSGKQPVLGELEPCATAGQDPCVSGTLNTVTGLTQDSTSHFLFNYNLGNGSDTGFRRFGGTQINFQNGTFDTTGTPIVLGLKGTGTTGGKLKLDFVDDTGDKVTVNVTGLTGSFQNYEVTKALLDSASVSGFDATKIKTIVIVTDNNTTGSTTATGTIDVNTGGLVFLPLATITADPLRDFSAKQPAASELEPCATAGQDPCVSGTLNTVTSFNQDSANHFALGFDLGNGSDTGFRRFAGALLNFDPSNFSSNSAIVIGLKGTGTLGGKVKIEFIDDTNDKVTVLADGITGSFQNYKITKALLDSAGIAGFDSTKIKAFAIVIDNVTTGSSAAVGTLEANIQGMKFVPTAAITANPVTSFSGKQPVVGELEPCATAGQDPCVSGTLNTITLLNQDSTSHFLFNYDLGNGSDTGFRRFGGTQINFQNGTFNTTGNPIVLGLKGAGTTGGKLKLDFVDDTGDKVTVNVTGLTGSFQNYEVTKALLDSAGISGFDSTKVKTIVVVVDNVTTGSNSATGTIEVNTAALLFTPTAVVTANPVTNFTAKQPTVGELEPCATAGQDPCVSGTLNTVTTFTQDSNGHFLFDYNLGNGSDTGFRRFGGTQINFGTNFFNTTGNPIVLGLKGTGTTGGKLKLDFVDDTGDKVTVNVTGLTGSFQNYQVTKALLDSANISGFDATKIKTIVIVVDNVTTGSTTATGTIEVNTQGLQFFPLAVETSDALTDFSAESPTTGAIEPCATAGQDPCVSGTLNTVTTFDQDTENHFEFDYNLGNGSDTGFRRFAGGLINFGVNPFDATTPIVLGFKGTGTTGGQVKLEFQDVSGDKVIVFVKNLTGSFKKYKITKALLDSAGIVGFDATQIKTITIVVDNTTTGSSTATGTIEVNTQGLA